MAQATSDETWDRAMAAADAAARDMCTLDMGQLTRLIAECDRCNCEPGCYCRKNREWAQGHLDRMRRAVGVRG